MKEMLKKMALLSFALFFFNFCYSQKLETFSKTADGDYYKIFKVSKNIANPVPEDFITFYFKDVYKKNGKDTVIVNTKKEPITIQLKTFQPNSAIFECLSKMSPGDSCVWLSNSDSIESIQNWVDKHSFVTNHIHLLSTESPVVKKKREENEIIKNLELCSYNIPQLLPNNDQCSLKLNIGILCKNGVVAGVNESTLAETYDQFKQFSTMIQLIQANKKGFTSVYGLPFNGRNVFQYDENPGGSDSPPDGVIYIFDGLCTIYPCDKIPGSEIIINGNGFLYFKLTKDKGLIYLKGKGSVSINNIVTNLPIKEKIAK